MTPYRRRSFQIWLSRAGIAFAFALDVTVGYLVASSYYGPGSQFVANGQYQLNISLPLYSTGFNRSSDYLGAIGVVHLTGETPLDHEVVAFQSVNIEVKGALGESGGGHAISFVFEGALVGPPRGTATTAYTQAVTSGPDGKFDSTFLVPGFYPTAGEFPVYAVDAVTGSEWTAQIPVEPSYLAQQSSISYVQLVLSIAIFFFALMESMIVFKELAPYAFPAGIGSIGVPPKPQSMEESRAGLTLAVAGALLIAYAFLTQIPRMNFLNMDPVTVYYSTVGAGAAFIFAGYVELKLHRLRLVIGKLEKRLFGEEEE